MNIKLIREIVNSNLPEDYIKSLIIQVLSKDEELIPTLLRVLHEERKENKDLLLDTNVHLSKALVILEKNIKGDKKNTIQSIKEHYLKWQHRIKCAFQIEGLP